ncbi:MAG: cyclic nucleotide-binding domain-containing protein [Desulfarculaceae bacterium]|nr:cyclic nucleotide-binding domain-containing protein [Desulfarculaceae bacterium]
MVDTKELEMMDFFRELPEKTVEKIARAARTETFGQGRVLFRQSENLTALYMLCAGKVHLKCNSATGGIHTLDEVLPGESFGISAFLGETKSTFSAVCAEESRIMTLSSDTISELFETEPSVGYTVIYQVVKLFKSRMDKHTRQFVNSMGRHPEIRAF